MKSETVPHTALDAAHVAAADFGFVGQRFLREMSLFAKLTNSLAKSP